MAQAFGVIASDVEQLNERVRDLERRVSALQNQPRMRLLPVVQLRSLRGANRRLQGRDGASRRRT
jgi:hypothetical protein